MNHLIKESAYKLLDIVTAGKGVEKHFNDFRLRLPVRFSRYFPQDYEHDNFEFLKEHCAKGNVVIDIGAHIGLFAGRAAQLTGGEGKVYAFEPTPGTQKLLQKTIAINKMQDCIVPRAEAIADKDGETFFYVSDNEGDNSNSLVGYRKDRELHKTKVRLTSVDNFVLHNKIRRVDFIKIDAEGFELGVLKGSKKTLQQFKPAVILALHPNGIASNGDTLEEIYDSVNQLGFAILYEKRIMSKEKFCSQTNLFDVHLIYKH